MSMVITKLWESKTSNMKTGNIFNYVLYLFWSLSIIAIILSFIEATSNYSLSLSYLGFATFIEIFLRFQTIFYTTILLTTVYYTIKSYLESQKNSKKELWFKIFKETLEELRDENGVIYKSCLLDIEKIFEYSNSITGTFKDEAQLSDCLDVFVKPWIDKIEMGSSEYEKYSGIYPFNEYSHSERTYFEILLHIGQPDTNFRQNFIDTFEKKYRDIVKNSDFGSTRIINYQEYKEILERPPIRYI